MPGVARRMPEVARRMPEVARRMPGVARRMPGALRVRLPRHSRRARTCSGAANSVGFVERGREAMEDSGLADGDKLRVIGMISSYTLSEARRAHDAARAARQAQAVATGTEPLPAWTWEGLVREVADEQTYPR